jgi:hypothetical protein
MTVIAPGSPVRPLPGPCLTTGRWAGPVITMAFVAAVALFLFGLLTMAG